MVLKRKLLLKYSMNRLAWQQEQKSKFKAWSAIIKNALNEQKMRQYLSDK